MAIFAKVKGKTQGDITGGVLAKGHVGEIEITSCEIGVHAPHDLTSGAPTGRRQWRPIQLIKPVDRSTPLLMNALIRNEVLTSVLISYWGTGKDGVDRSFATVTLTNAMIADFNQLEPEHGTGSEKVSLTFTKIDSSFSTALPAGESGR